MGITTIAPHLPNIASHALASAKNAKTSPYVCNAQTTKELSSIMANAVVQVLDISFIIILHRKVSNVPAVIHYARRVMVLSLLNVMSAMLLKGQL